MAGPNFDQLDFGPNKGAQAPDLDDILFFDRAGKRNIVQNRARSTQFRGQVRLTELHDGHGRPPRDRPPEERERATRQTSPKTQPPEPDGGEPKRRAHRGGRRSSVRRFDRRPVPTHGTLWERVKFLWRAAHRRKRAGAWTGLRPKVSGYGGSCRHLDVQLLVSLFDG